MQKSQIFEILEIAETTDKQQIEQAYYNKLQHTNPEDKPEEFKLLRQAYDEAVALAEVGEDKTPVGRWIKRAEDIYNNFELRCDSLMWEELLEDEVCTDLSTFSLARKRILYFMMEHYYLPGYVYDLIINSFRLREDSDELNEYLPKGFLSFVISKVASQGIEYITATDGVAADKAINLWYSFIRSDNDDGVDELIKEYRTLDVIIPYFEINIALYNIDEDIEGARKTVEQYKELVYKDNYIIDFIVNLYIRLGEGKKAKEILDYASEKHLISEDKIKILYARLDVLKGNLFDARKRLIKLYNKSYDRDVMDNIVEINDLIIKTFKPKTSQDKLKLAWCHYQNEQNDEALKIAQGLEMTELDDIENRYHLLTCIFLAADEFDNALEYIAKWREALVQIEPKDEEADEEKRRKLVSLAIMASTALRTLSAERDDDEELLNKALEYADEKTVCMHKAVMQHLWVERAYVLMALKRYEAAIALCDRLAEDEEQHLTSCLIREECYYKMGKPAEAVDCFKEINNIAENLPYTRPYAIAAQIYFNFNAYENALRVLWMAEQNGAADDSLTFLKASILRCMAQNSSEIQKQLEVLLELSDRHGVSSIDFPKASRIALYREICFTYMDLRDWSNALEFADKAISIDADNVNNYGIRLNIYRESGSTISEKKELRKLKRKFGETAFYYYQSALSEENDKLKIKLYKKAIKIEPNYRDTISKIREAYVNSYLTDFNYVSFKNAIEYATMDVRLNPYPDYYMNRGIVYMLRNMVKEAEPDFRKAIGLDEDSIYANEWLGDCLRIQGRHEEAVKYYKAAYDMAQGNGNVNPPKDYALGLEANMDYDGAIAVLKKMLEDFPNELFVWHWLARNYKKKGDYKSAYDVLMQYRENNKKNKERVLRTEGELLEIMIHIDGTKEEAYNMVKKSLNRNRGSMMAHLNMAWYHCYYRNDGHLTEKYTASMLEAAKEYEYTYAIKRRAELLNMCGAPLARFALLGDLLRNENLIDINESALEDRRYAKMEISDFAIYFYYIGNFKMSFELFAKMDEYNNCATCNYNICVERLLGKALKCELENNYDTALEYLERILLEGYDGFVIKRHIERIKNEQKDVTKR